MKHLLKSLSLPLFVTHNYRIKFKIRVIQVYASTNNAEEAEVDWFYEDLQDLLELTPPKDVLFTIGEVNANVGS